MTKVQESYLVEKNPDCLITKKKNIELLLEKRE